LPENIELSSGSQGFLDMLFHFVSRKFSPKRAENGLLENSGFLTIGLEKKAFSEEMRVENNF
jgi:hypothetical protein